MKKYYFLFSFLFFILFINSCSKDRSQQQTIQNSIQTASSEDVSILTPEQVVTLYFQSWNDKKYDIMYSLISDGFKKLEPTAESLEDFQLYTASFFETEKSISVVEAEEAYSTDDEAGVNYRIEITGKDGTKKGLENAYTLKKRGNGWKLIHPYGENIDTS